jgi:hypothetical protein
MKDDDNFSRRERVCGYGFTHELYSCRKDSGSIGMENSAVMAEANSKGVNIPRSKSLTGCIDGQR